MGFRKHQIEFAHLREGEEVLHNCSGHPLLHLRLPLLYLISILLPFLGLFFLVSADIISDDYAQSVLWFLYSCYALIMSTYFFVRCVNSELSGCIITNQRIVRFGYKGLSQIIEREILPNKIDDFKVEKKGVLSIVSDTAYVYIRTADQQTEVLKNVIQAKEIQNAYASLIKTYRSRTFVSGSDKEDSSQKERDAGWIDDALGQSQGSVRDVDFTRDEVIEDIGDVFTGGSKE